MTLRQWCDEANIDLSREIRENGSVGLAVNESYPTFRQLWNLEDYFVSSRVAGVVWLVPKTPGLE